MSPADIARMKAEIRKEWRALAKVYPGAFDKNGRPLVATLRLPGAAGKGDKA